MKKTPVPPVNSYLKNHTFMHLAHKIYYSIFPGLNKYIQKKFIKNIDNICYAVMYSVKRFDMEV